MFVESHQTRAMDSKALPSLTLWIHWSRRYITGQCISEKALMVPLHQKAFKKSEDAIWIKNNQRRETVSPSTFGKNNSVSSVYWVPSMNTFCFIVAIKILQGRFYYPYFYSGINCISKNSGDLIKFNHVINNRARIWTQVSDSKSCTFPFWENKTHSTKSSRTIKVASLNTNNSLIPWYN